MLYMCSVFYISFGTTKKRDKRCIYRNRKGEGIEQNEKEEKAFHRFAVTGQVTLINSFLEDSFFFHSQA